MNVKKIMHMIPIAINFLLTVRNFPIYFIHRFRFIKKGKITYKLWNGMKVICRPFPIDKAVLNEVWFERCYDPNYFSIPYHWNTCRTVIDIGARLGAFSLFAAHKAPNSVIYSFEPDPKTAEVLMESVQASKLVDRITVSTNAVCANRGMLDFYVAEDCSGWSSFYKPPCPSIKISVQVLSLADVFDQHAITMCDFLKIDCEGAEYKMLYNLPVEYFAKIKFIAIEYHIIDNDARHTPEALYIFLEQKGYKVYRYKKYHVFAERIV